MGLLSRLFGGESNASHTDIIKPIEQVARVNTMTDYVVMDIETSGLNAEAHKIIEIAAIKVVEGQPASIFTTFVQYRGNLSPTITKLTGIDSSQLRDAPDRRYVMSKFDEFIDDLPLVGHNISQFDNKFLWFTRMSLGLPESRNEVIDTLDLSRSTFNFDSYKLSNLCDSLGIQVGNTHRALDDAKLTLRLFERILEHRSDDISPVAIRYDSSSYYADKMETKFIEKSSGAGGVSLSGLRFCITTFVPFGNFNSESQLQQCIVDNGGTVGGIARATDYLIDCDPLYVSSKEKKALADIENGKSNIKIITPKELLSMIA